MNPDKETAEFLLRACHDLRSPARAMRTNAELILRNAGSLEQSLAFIVDGAKGIDAILDGLAGYAVALQTDPATFAPARTDVLLRFVLTKLEKDLRAAGGEVIYANLPLVNGNADRLMQLFENLVRNALVHRGEAEPRIEIGAYADVQGLGEGWLFTVRDNGPGIEAEYVEHIFKPFERLRRDRGGAGLGLAICRAIVERHGGRIWAEASPEGGVIRFTLPGV